MARPGGDFDHGFFLIVDDATTTSAALLRQCHFRTMYAMGRRPLRNITVLG
jgi:hypothetical protein